MHKETVQEIKNEFPFIKETMIQQTGNQNSNEVQIFKVAYFNFEQVSKATILKQTTAKQYYIHPFCSK